MTGVENKVSISINEVPGGKRKLNNKTGKMFKYIWVFVEEILVENI